MSQHADSDPADPRVVRALEEYLAALEAGRPPDRADFVARHPDDLADELSECIAGLELMHAAVPAVADDRTPRPGTLAGLLLTDYRVLREIGRGGMGVVYEAEQLSLRRRVALKVLPLAATLDPRQRQRFQNEAQAAAHLQHPNIVPVYAVGSEHGVHYYAMQFIDGQTVADLIRRLRRQAGPADGVDHTDSCSPGVDTPVLQAPATTHLEGSDGLIAAPPPTERSRAGQALFRWVAQLGVQAARALEYAHQTGVIHRDVKPANLLLDTRGNLWVTDFGLAQVRGQPGLTATGDLLGTLRYMSPEQASARHGLVDHRSDVYALGATLYELLTLRPAVPGETREEVLRHVLLDEPRLPRRLDPAVPAELETVVLKALAKDPQERYATAGELAEDLRRFLEDQPIHARPPTARQRLRRWARRHRPLAVALGVTAVLLPVAVLLLTLLYSWQRQQLAAEHAAFAEQQAQDQARVAREQQQEREKTAGQLFEALVGRAGALRLVHEPGYRGLVWADLHKAADLKFPGKNLEALRPEVLGCLGDPFGLGAVAVPAAAPAVRPPVPVQLRQGFPEMGGKKLLLAVSPDGRHLACDCLNGRVTLWKTDGAGPTPFDVIRACCDDDAGGLLGKPEQKPIAQTKVTLGRVFDLTFTADGHNLIAACARGVLILSIPELHPRWTLGGDPKHSVAAHPHLPWFATAGKQQVELWSFPYFGPRAVFPLSAEGARVAFSANGRYLLALVDDKVHSAWPVRTTPEKDYLDDQRTEGKVQAVAFSADSRRLAAGSQDGRVRVWDVPSGRLLYVCPSHRASAEAVAFSPDGRLLVSGDAAGGLYWWDAASGKELPAKAAMPPGRVRRLQFTPDGKKLAAAGALGVMLWEVPAPGQPWAPAPELNMYLSEVVDLVIHPRWQEMAILAGDSLGTPTNLYVYRLEPPPKVGFPRPVRSLGIARLVPRSLAADAGGEHLLCVAADGTLTTRAWFGTGREQPTGRQASHLALSPDDRWVATPGARCGVVVCERQTGQELLTLPKAEEEASALSLAWSPDGARLALGLPDGGLVLWNLEQVRDRLAEFGIVIPSTRAGGR
jgi:serine/threonine protein kinase/WD40 repeat protein